MWFKPGGKLVLFWLVPKQSFSLGVFTGKGEGQEMLRRGRGMRFIV